MSEETIPYFERMKLIKLGLLPKEAVPKKKKPLRNKSLKTQAQEAEAKKSNSVEGKEETLNDWFQKIENKHWGIYDQEMVDIGGQDCCKCMECGKLISRTYARRATAHLLPKKLFKSIATNDLNYLILGSGCGCHDKTHRIDKFVTMKIWPQAAKQINELLKVLPYDELKYVSQQLYDALENY